VTEPDSAVDGPVVSCPHCSALFEIEEEYRGEAVDCPKCEAPFRIPMSGSDGEPLADEELDAFDVTTEDAEGPSIEVSCPQCQTLFEVPEAYCGEQAECSECEALFTIPGVGSTGLDVEEPEAEPEPEPAPNVPGTTASGIQVTEPGAIAPEEGLPTLRDPAPAAGPTDTVVVSRDTLPPQAADDVTDSGIEKGSLKRSRR